MGQRQNPSKPYVEVSTEPGQLHIAGIFLAWLIFCTANYYFDLGLLGPSAKGPLLLSLLVFALAHHFYGPKMLQQLKAYKRLKRIRENVAGSNRRSVAVTLPNNRWRGL